MTAFCGHGPHDGQDCAVSAPAAGLPPCARHFTDLSAQILQGGFADPDILRDVLNHIGRHGWAGSALLTWAGMLGRYVCPPGVDRAAAVQTLTAPPAGAGAWMPLWLMTVRAILHHDGTNLAATLSSMQVLDNDDRASMIASLAGSASCAAAAHPEATARTVHLFQLYGSQVISGTQWEILEDLVEATGEIPPGVPLAALRRLLEPERIRLALPVAVRALSGFLSAGGDGPLLMTTAGDGTLGYIDWRGDIPDDSSPDSAIAWGMRAAVECARGRLVQAGELIAAAPDPHRRAAETLYGTLVIMNRVLAAADDPPAAGAG